MATNMPTGLDSFTDPTVNDTLDNVGGVTTHHGLHDIANDALTQIEKLTVGPFAYNVKGYGAKGDGSTDDTIAIQAALTAANTAGGGLVMFPAGTYLTGLLTIYSKVHIRGAGIEATILKLKNGANSSLLQSSGFASLTGGNTTGGIFNFSLADLTLDGNKGNNSSSTSACLQIYGFGYIVRNLRVRNGAHDGMYSEWSSNSTPLVPDSMEAQLVNVKSHEHVNDGLVNAGPLGSQFTNVITYYNGRYGFWVKANGAGGQYSHCHNYGLNNLKGFYFQGQSNCVNCISEGSNGGDGSVAGVAVHFSANDCSWIGGEIVGEPGTNLQTGIQIGDTGFSASGTTVLTKIISCGGGGINFNNDLGANWISANVYAPGSYAGFTGTPVQPAYINMIVTGGGQSLFTVPNNAGSIALGYESLATNAAGGFPIIPHAAGAPTGTPFIAGGVTGTPMLYDTTNHKIWFYDGSWRGVVVS